MPTDTPRLIFLDIDGVLNTHEPLCSEALCGRLHQDKVARLNNILRETNARIVLSSAWRYLVHRGEMNLVGLDWLLRSHGVMAGMLVGITSIDTMRESPEFDGKAWPVDNERGEQIQQWLDTWTPNVDSYVVIDDLDLGISESGHPFIQTNSKVGMTDKDERLAVNMLMTRKVKRKESA